MPKKNEPSKKEVYGVWREYLRRSEKYKQYIEWAHNEFSKIFLYPPPQRAKIEKTPLPLKFRGLLSTYAFFGDVFNKKSFDKQYNNLQDLPGRIIKKEDSQAVYILESDFEEALDGIINDLQYHNKRKPSIEEFKKRILEYLKRRKDTLWVAVSLSPIQNIDTICNQFRNILRKRLISLGKEPTIDDVYYPLIPTQPLRFDEIKRYLDVYDLRMEGRKWREILIDKYPNYKVCRTETDFKKKEYLERSLHIDFNNAKKIIKNVERGLFPGKY